MKSTVTIERFGVPEKKKKNKVWGLIAILFIVLVMAILISIAIAYSLRCNIEKIVTGGDIDSTWIGSVASYWGGIIGGIISGIFGFLGVFFTIRYYKESDSEKERNALQPFLLASTSVKKEVELKKGFYYEKDCDKSKANDYPVYIKNIGNGFANIIAIYTNYNVGGIAFNEVVDKNAEVGFWIVAAPESIKDGAAFNLLYIDAMRNEYMQKYEFRIRNGVVELESGYPLFVGEQ